MVIEGGTADAGLPPGTSRMQTTLDSSLLRERFGLAAPDALSVVETVIGSAKAQGLERLRLEHLQRFRAVPDQPWLDRIISECAFEPDLRREYD